jgi:hypothetical protein
VVNTKSRPIFDEVERIFDSLLSTLQYMYPDQEKEQLVSNWLNPEALLREPAIEDYLGEDEIKMGVECFQFDIDYMIHAIYKNGLLAIGLENRFLQGKIDYSDAVKSVKLLSQVAGFEGMLKAMICADVGNKIIKRQRKSAERGGQNRKEEYSTAFNKIADELIKEQLILSADKKISNKEVATTIEPKMRDLIQAGSIQVLSVENLHSRLQKRVGKIRKEMA